jgi:pilus assembly protein CpaF
MLQAMNTGHEGSLSTIHSNSPRDALNRLETMVLMAGYELPVKAIRQHVAAALDLIIQLDRLDDGSRRITQITEVQRMEGDMITLQSLFEFKLDRVEADRTVIGRLEPSGLRPTFLKKFERHGIEISSTVFGDSEAAMFGTPANGHRTALPGGKASR